MKPNNKVSFCITFILGFLGVLLLGLDGYTGYLFLNQVSENNSIESDIEHKQGEVESAEDLIVEKKNTRDDLFEEYSELLEASLGDYSSSVIIVEKLRELTAEEPLATKTMSREALESYLVREYNLDYTLEDQEVDEKALGMLGLIDENDDIRKIAIEFQTAAILGFYEPDKDKMFVIAEPGSVASEYNKFIFAHEYTHYLQDEHWGIDDLQDEYEENDNSDAIYAISAVIEGDASIVEEEYKDYLSENDSSAYDQLLDEELEIQSSFDIDLSSIPSFFIDTSYFPYIKGEKFVSEVKNQGGWQAVDSLYEKLPVSTEQIIHPEKYSEWEEPIQINPGDRSSKIGPGWSYLDQDVMGEMFTSITLNVALDKSDSDEAAEGWNGDRLQFYEHSDGTIIGIWESYWDSDDDTKEFLEAFGDYSSYLGYKYKYREEEDGKLVIVFGDYTGLIEILNDI